MPFFGTSNSILANFGLGPGRINFFYFQNHFLKIHTQQIPKMLNFIVLSHFQLRKWLSKIKKRVLPPSFPQPTSSSKWVGEPDLYMSYIFGKLWHFITLSGNHFSASYKVSDFCWQTILYFLEHLRPSHILKAISLFSSWRPKSKKIQFFTNLRVRMRFFLSACCGSILMPPTYPIASLNLYAPNFSGEA